MQIVDLKNAGTLAKEQAARILVESFKEIAPTAWPTMEAALKEVQESFGEDRISRAALDETGRMVGWIGGIDAYDGHAWELHPLAVDPQFQGQRIGTALVQDFENLLREQGATTIWLGSDDESNQTSLGGGYLSRCFAASGKYQEPAPACVRLLSKDGLHRGRLDPRREWLWQTRYFDG